MISGKILIIGFQDSFKNSILNELRKTFKDVLVVSSISGSDIDYWDFLRMNVDFQYKSVNTDMQDCIVFCLDKFRKFCEIYTRSQYYIPKPTHEIYNYFIVLILFSYKVIKENNIHTIIYGNIPHEAHIFALSLVGNFLKAKPVICYQSHIPDRFFIFEDISELGDFKSGVKLSKRIEEKYVLPESWSYMRNLKKDYSYNLPNFLLEVLRSPIRIYPAILRYKNATQYRLNVKNLVCKKVKLDVDYVYFPLQLQPELTTNILGGDYADQMYAIEVLSNILPEGVKIYVKENPKQTELERGASFFRRMKSLSNVVLVDRSYSSRLLISHSQFVAVLNGTAGWEALNLGKPVLIFGHSWYQNFSGVTKFKRGIKYDEVLANRPVIEHLSGQHNDLMEYAAEGVVDDHYLYMIKESSLELNAKKVANSIFKFLNR